MRPSFALENGLFIIRSIIYMKISQWNVTLINGWNTENEWDSCTEHYSVNYIVYML